MSIDPVTILAQAAPASRRIKAGDGSFALEDARPLSETARALTAEEAAKLPWTPTSTLASLNEIMQLGEYLSQSSAAHQAGEAQREARFNALNRGIGNMLNGAAVPNDIFSNEPVRTTSGAIHPQSDQIKAYLRDHATEWNDIFADSFPSYEEWCQSRT